MKLIIGADMVPTQSNIDLFCTADATALVGEDLLEILNGADYRIFNLETPLADRQTPIAKCGPALIAPTGTAAGMKALGVDLFTLANNHILDQGAAGLSTTIQTLEQQGIAYVGVGETPQQAAKPYMFSFAEKLVGVYACCEHEFSVVTQDNAGANPFDPLETLDHIAALKAQCDYVIVLYHGGKEHYRYPSPSLQKTCRKLVEKGADLVLCQHSHCIGCEEKYKNATIVYGQGNFLFDYDDDPYELTSLLVQVEEDFCISYLPLQKRGNGVQLAKEAEAREILDAFAARSQEIKDPMIVQERYAHLAESVIHDYLTHLGGTESFIFRVINKLLGNKLRLWRTKRRYPVQMQLKLRNFMECEAYRELVLQGLRKK